MSDVHYCTGGTHQYENMKKYIVFVIVDILLVEVGESNQGQCHGGGYFGGVLPGDIVDCNMKKEPLQCKLQ